MFIRGCGLWLMTISTKDRLIVFLRATAFSGLNSCLAGSFGPLSVIAPGALFGFSLAYAIDKTIQPLEFRRMASVAAASTLSFIVALLVCVSSASLRYCDLGIWSTAIHGAAAGGSGSLCLALSLAAMVRRLRSWRFVCAMSCAGAILGGFCEMAAMFILFHTRLVEPLSSVPLILIWQVGVGAVVAITAKTSGRIT